MGFPLREKRSSRGQSLMQDGAGSGTRAHLTKCFFLVPASLAVMGDIMLSVGETIDGLLLNGRTVGREKEVS